MAASIVKFWQELKRRKVIRVAVAYALVAWIVVEVASVLLPMLLLPDWSPRLVTVLALLGFQVWSGYGRTGDPVVEFVDPGAVPIGALRPSPEATSQ